MRSPFATATLVLVATLIAACPMRNPAFDESRQELGDDNSRGSGSEEASSSPSESSESNPGDGDGDGDGESSEAEGDGDPGSGDGDGDLDSGDGDGALDSGDGDGNPFPGILALEAGFSGCRGLEGFGPQECALLASEGAADVYAIVIDQQDEEFNYLAACMIFSLDDFLVGLNVTEVVLELHTIDESWAASTNSGEVVKVDPFTPQSFNVELPGLLDIDPIAFDLGPVTPFVPVAWELPADVVSPNSELHLCLNPLSADGAYYYSHEGEFPPVLYISYD